MEGGYLGEWIPLYIYMSGCLHCSSATITTLLIGHTPIQAKKFKVWAAGVGWELPMYLRFSLFHAGCQEPVVHWTQVTAMSLTLSYATIL